MCELLYGQKTWDTFPKKIYKWSMIPRKWLIPLVIRKMQILSHNMVFPHTRQIQDKQGHVTLKMWKNWILIHSCWNCKIVQPLWKSLAISADVKHRVTEVGKLVTTSCPTLRIPWTVAHQALLSMGFPRQEDWGEVAISFSGDLPYPGV